MVIAGGRSTIIERAAPGELATSYAAAAETLQHVIVRLTDDSGEFGYGEATIVPGYTVGTAQQIDQCLQDELIPRLLQRSPFDIAAWHSMLARESAYSSAIAALDMALYDLQAKLTGQPVVNLFGGKMRPCAAISFPIGICPADQAAALAIDAVSRGITTIKLKIGRDEDADLARLQAVRQAVGSDINIRVDANGIYSVPDAVRIINRLARYELQLVEQPVRAGDVRGMAAVRHETGVPVMVDEGLRNLEDLIAVINLKAADYIAIKLISVGGNYPALAMIQLAATYDLGVVVSSPSDTQIGAAAVLALALAAPTGDLAHEMRVFDSQPELADTDIFMNNGSVYPSHRPGLGVQSIVELGKFFDVPG